MVALLILLNINLKKKISKWTINTANCPDEITLLLMKKFSIDNKMGHIDYY